MRRAAADTVWRSLNVTYEVDTACEAIAVPTLLQPLVENSLRHGLAPRAALSLVIGATQSGDEVGCGCRMTAPACDWI